MGAIYNPLRQAQIPAALGMRLVLFYTAKKIVPPTKLDIYLYLSRSERGALSRCIKKEEGHFFHLSWREEPCCYIQKKKIGMNSRGGKEEKRGLVDNTLEQGWAAKAMDADEQRRGRERKKSLLFLESIRKRVFS